jgi:hypothetical protein
MGNFYSSIVTKGPLAQAVANAVHDRTAFVVPGEDGCALVCDEHVESDGPEAARELALSLSRSLSCAALAITNHDDDVLLLDLCVDGELVDSYNSAPSFFDPDAEPAAPEGGNAADLCQAFNSANVASVEEILRKSSYSEDGYVFAVERHAALAGQLGLPSFFAGTGFAYLAAQEFPEGLNPGAIIRVP